MRYMINSASGISSDAIDQEALADLTRIACAETDADPNRTGVAFRDGKAFGYRSKKRAKIGAPMITTKIRST